MAGAGIRIGAALLAAACAGCAGGHHVAGPGRVACVDQAELEEPLSDLNGELAALHARLAPAQHPATRRLLRGPGWLSVTGTVEPGSPDELLVRTDHDRLIPLRLGAETRITPEDRKAPSRLAPGVRVKVRGWTSGGVEWAEHVVLLPRLDKDERSLGDIE